MKTLHYPPRSAWVALLTFLLLLVTAGSGSFGCGEVPAQPGLPPAWATRLRFPDQAPAVLASGEGFVSTAEHFALGASPTPGIKRGFEISLSRDGRSVVRLRDRGGFEVQARELSIEGQAALTLQAVAYRRSGETSFQTSAPDGVDEWLHLEAGPVREGEPGTRLELWTEAEQQELLGDALWTSAGSLTDAHKYHSATLLPSGQVLVVGGFSNGGELASAEQYDPATNIWTPVASLSSTRQLHSATLLSSGQVLVVGGFGNGGELASAERYDPATNTWTPATSLSSARQLHTATPLPSGQVMVVGGAGKGGELTSAELYDPAPNTWTPAASLSSARSAHTATLLPSDQVLIVGGVNKVGFLASAELYDPASNTWAPAASLSSARDLHTATLLPSGPVLVVGGSDNVSVLASAEVYTPSDPPSSHCTSPTTCQSGFCVDGVCCDNICTGICAACSAAKKGGGLDGFCGPITAGQDPENECTAEPTASCGTTGVCDGKGTCQKYPTGTLCVTLSCASATATVARICDGNGTCQADANPTECPPPSGDCERGLCEPITANCFIGQKLDGAPCKGGVCIAGGCYIERGSSASSSSSTGAGGEPSAGSSAASTASSSSSTPTTGAGPGAKDAGVGGSAEEIRLHGGACGISPDTAASTTWLGLGLLFLRRRQPRKIPRASPR